MLIIARTYNNFEIDFSTFETEENIFINATKVAKQFNKKPDNWLRNQDVKDYIFALENRFSNLRNELVIVKQGGKPQEQGTWIHQKLIVAFARWLSSDFAVWCDMTLEEILKSQTQTSQNLQLPEIGNSTQHIIELKNDVLETSSLIEILRNLNPIDLYRLDKFYRKFHNFSPLEHFEIDIDSQFFLPTELGKMINKSAVEINLILEHKGFQLRENGVWQLTESGRDFGILIVGKYNQIKWKIKTVL